MLAALQGKGRIILVQTVLGAVSAKSLGITMCHEHLALDLSPVRGGTDSVFDDQQLIGSELGLLVQQGCGTVVEVTCNDMGRNVASLCELSRRSHIHILAATGFYLRPYHPPWLLAADVDKVAALFIDELETGIGDSGVRAGLIGEIATSSERIYDTERKVFEAAAIASAQTGCAVSTHCDGGKRGLEQLEILRRGNAALNKVILGHTDLVDDTAYQLELLSSGANIAFDTVGKTAYLSDEKRADNLTALVDAGYVSRLLLSQDVSRLSYMVANGGRGYTAVLGNFVRLLRERGLADSQLNDILVHNPARILNR